MEKKRTTKVFGCLFFVLVIGLGVPLLIVPSFRVRFASRFLGIEPSLERLVTISNDKDALEIDREWATKRLAKFQDPRAVPELLKIVQYGYDIDNRRTAAETLVALHKTEVIPELLEMIKDGYGTDARYEVKNNLSASRALIGLQAPEVIDPLIRSGESISNDEVFYLVSGMWVFQQLADALKSNKDSSVRVGAALILGKKGDEFCIKTLVEVFQIETNVDVRRSIIQALSGKPSLFASKTVRMSLGRAQPPQVRVAAAKALLAATDDSAVITMIGFFPFELNADVREELLNSLCKVNHDPRVIKTLLEALQPNNPENIRNTAAQCLSTTNNPTLKENFLYALKHDRSLQVRVTVVKALTSFRDARTDSAVAISFTDADYRVTWVVYAVGSYGWAPRSNRQKVYWWIALHNSTLLQANWEMTKQVLLADIVSGHRDAAEYAMKTFIALGREEIITPLVNALNRHGTKALAEVYLNCGHEVLEKSAEDWASRHGYFVMRSPGSGMVKWGSMR